MKDRDEMQERERLIMEWMRSDAAFKTLARRFGKGGRAATLGDEAEQEPYEEPSAELGKQGGGQEAFKGLAKKFGQSYPKPTPKG